MSTITQEQKERKKKKTKDTMSNKDFITIKD